MVYPTCCYAHLSVILYSIPHAYYVLCVLADIYMEHRCLGLQSEYVVIVPVTSLGFQRVGKWGIFWSTCRYKPTLWGDLSFSYNIWHEFVAWFWIVRWITPRIIMCVKQILLSFGALYYSCCCRWVADWFEERSGYQDCSWSAISRDNIRAVSQPGGVVSCACECYWYFLSTLSKFCGTHSLVVDVLRDIVARWWFHRCATFNFDWSWIPGCSQAPSKCLRSGLLDTNNVDGVTKRQRKYLRFAK